MLVKELIEALKCQPQDNTVMLAVMYDSHYVISGEAEHIEYDGYYTPGITSIWSEV